MKDRPDQPWLPTAIAALPLVLMLTLAAIHVVAACNRPWDGTTFEVIPSRLHLAPIAGSAGGGPAHMLLRIEGKRHRTLASAQRSLASSAGQEGVAVELWEPLTDRTHTVTAAAGQLLGQLREIPPATRVGRISPAGFADEAGVAVGDLIVAIGGQGLGAYEEPQLFYRLLTAVYRWRGVDGQAAAHADYLVRKREPGDTLAFDLLRGGQPVRKQVRMARKGSELTFVLALVLGGVSLLLGSLAMVRAARRKLPMSGLAVWLAALYALFVLIGRPLEQGTPGRLRDFGVLLPFVALALARWQDAGGVSRRPRSWVSSLGRLVPTASRFVPPRAPAAALGAILLVVVAVAVGADRPELVPSIVRERVIAPGAASVFVFTLLGGVFCFGALQLFAITWLTLRPSRPGSRGNAALANAVAAGDGDSVDRVMRSDVVVTQGYYGRRAAEVRRVFSVNPEVGALEFTVDELIERDIDDVRASFAVVRWCEAALPLLGFLGTVMGIGAALPRMSAVIESGTQGESVMGALRRAFQDLGFAFDTTLVGLIGVLALGVCHSFVDRRLGIHLGIARGVLRKYGELLGPTSIVASVAAVQMQVAALLAEMSAAREERQRLIAVAESLVNHGHTEPWKEMRRILSRAVVSFDELWDERKKFLEKQGLSKWAFVGLAVAPDSPRAFGLLTAKRALHVLRFAPSGGGEELLPIDATAKAPAGDAIRGMVCSHKGRYLAVLGEEQEVWELALHADRPTGSRLLLPAPHGDQRAGNQRQLWAGRLGKTEVLFVADTRDKMTTLSYQELGKEGEAVALGPPVRWPLLAADRAGSTFVAAARDEHGTFSIVRFRAEALDHREGGPTNVSLVPRGRLELAKDFLLDRIFVVDRDRVLLFPKVQFDGKQGQEILLHDFRSSSPTPLPRVPEWPTVDEVQVGGNWLAVRSGTSLSMWRLASAGRLDPYEEENGLPRTLSVTGAGRTDRERLVASSDGLFLMSAAGSAISTWRFPRQEIDELRGS